MTAASTHCCRAFAAALLVLLSVSPAWAHKASDAYLQLTGAPTAPSLRVDVALRDLDVALDVDTDGDSRLTWGEVRGAWPAIEAYVRSRVQVAGCDFGNAARSLERRVDGVYAALTWPGTCRADASRDIRYTVLGDVDTTHRGIARIAIDGQTTVLRVLDPGRPTPGTTHAAKAPPASFLAEGVHHILTGYDHVLFLMCLLLPAVMRRTPAGWRPVERLGQAVWPVLGIVTAFTLAHSITLALAALKLASLPPWFIEPAIAATIVLAAFDNVRPIFKGPRAGVTFAFGLIHGFGFAGVLGELDLSASQFAWALLQFNLGLELGQIAIVAAATTLLFMLRERPRYPAWVIRGGSLAAIAIGLLWFIERTADVSLLSL